MSDHEEESEFTGLEESPEDTAAQAEEFKLLKQQAEIMQLKFHPSIKLDALRQKITDRKNEVKKAEKNQVRRDKAQEKRNSVQGVVTAPPVASSPTALPEGSPEYLKLYDETANALPQTTVAVNTPPMSPNQKRAIRYKEATRLVRIRVTNMNPNKSKHRGEIISVGNASIGFVKKFIPFNAEAGWHTPQIILTMMQNRKFTSFYEVTIAGKKVKRHKLIPEFAIEILPPLTVKEMDELAQRQRAKSGQEDTSQ
ncbi:MAG: hypothetical protein DRH06_09840 [Deltaproteobacteria bacterium]|nr:MAG: hypothetical protein DRH06_09840 [Deltaproteobacteria bacterium]